MKKLLTAAVALAIFANAGITNTASATGKTSTKVTEPTTTVVTSEVLLLNPDDMAYLEEKKADFLMLNPGATEDEMEAYLKQVIHEAMAVSQNGTEGYGLLFGESLNATERALYDENPSVGDDCIYEATVAYASATLSDYPGEHNGLQDAYRHAYWNALMLDEVGRYWAERWGNAHEAVATQPQIEKSMDLTNNERGRQAAEEVINSNYIVTDGELKNKVMAYISAGKMVYIKNGYLVASNQ